MRDLVMTLEHGLQPLRRVGQRSVPAVGNLALNQMKAGTFSAHQTLMVLSQHRVPVRRIEGGDVPYVDILFDQHQVVW